MLIGLDWSFLQRNSWDHRRRMRVSRQQMLHRFHRKGSIISMKGNMGIMPSTLELKPGLKKGSSLARDE